MQKTTLDKKSNQSKVKDNGGKQYVQLYSL